MRRHEIDYHRPALPGEEIVEETWVERMTGAKSERRSRFTRASDGAPLVRGAHDLGLRRRGDPPPEADPAGAARALRRGRRRARELARAGGALELQALPPPDQRRERRGRRRRRCRESQRNCGVGRAQAQQARLLDRRHVLEDPAARHRLEARAAADARRARPAASAAARRAGPTCRSAPASRRRSPYTTSGTCVCVASSASPWPSTRRCRTAPRRGPRSRAPRPSGPSFSRQRPTSCSIARSTFAAAFA